MRRVSSSEGRLNDPPPPSSAQIKLSECVYLLSLSFCHHRIRELIMERQFMLLPAGSGSISVHFSAHMRLINHRNRNKKMTRVLPGTRLHW